MMLRAVAALALLVCAEPSGARPARCAFGIASFYGRWHDGRRMANGHPFHMNGRTAASLTLPLGARVLIRDLDNDATELVTITDRGPYVRGRIIDLSAGTARRLGFTRDGLAPVAICRQ